MVVIHGLFCCAICFESWCVILWQLVWIMVSNVDPDVVNHRELCSASGCESCCVLLSQWFMNHGVLYRAKGFESWCAMLIQWLWGILCHVEPVVVYHLVLCSASGWDSWCVMLRQWLWIMVSYDEPVVVYQVNKIKCLIAFNCYLWQDMTWLG